MRAVSTPINPFAAAIWSDGRRPRILSSCNPYCHRPPLRGERHAPSGAAAPTDASAVAQLKSGASWFYWIAGLSLINSISAASGSSWRFIVGLGITQIFDEFGNHMGTGGRWVALRWICWLQVFLCSLACSRIKLSHGRSSLG